jgi:hypothetical protein
MAIDLQTIEERLAKAKEEAAFWEKARAILEDPRLKDLITPQPRPVSSAQSTFTQAAAPRAYGELKSRVYAVLPDADTYASSTTQQIVDNLIEAGYVFQAKEPTIAVNGALVALEGQGLAEAYGKRGNAKLWRKKRQKREEQNQEAPEGAS